MTVACGQWSRPTAGMLGEAGSTTQESVTESGWRRADHESTVQKSRLGFKFYTLSTLPQLPSRDQVIGNRKSMKQTCRKYATAFLTPLLPTTSNATLVNRYNKIVAKTRGAKLGFPLSLATVAALVEVSEWAVLQAINCKLSRSKPISIDYKMRVAIRPSAISEYWTLLAAPVEQIESDAQLNCPDSPLSVVKPLFPNRHGCE